MKNELRKKYKIIRNALDESFRKSASEKICESILSLDEYKKAQTIMSYWAINTEVMVDTLIQNALDEKKCVFLPVCDTKSETMYSARLFDIKKIVRGSYGICEPEGRQAFNASGIDVVIVPALVYNRRGFRIGYGKGYYDKFFADCTGAFKIGAAYSCQLCEENFAEPFDARVDMIVTEKEVIYCEERRI